MLTQMANVKKELIILHYYDAHFTDEKDESQGNSNELLSGRI